MQNLGESGSNAPATGGSLWNNAILPLIQSHGAAHGLPPESTRAHAMEENRKKALVAALGQIEKQFGKGSVMRLGDAAASYDVEAVSTGSLGLDIALGVGGLPRGRVVEIYGPESSGKTTLALTAIAEVQRKGGTFCSTTDIGSGICLGQYSCRII